MLTINNIGNVVITELLMIKIGEGLNIQINFSINSTNHLAIFHSNVVGRMDFFLSV